MTEPKVEEIEEVFASELHKSIREKLDPESLWLSADEILQILRISAGDRRRASHKCILAMYYRALRKKDPEAVIKMRHKLMAFEDGRLIITAKPEDEEVTIIRHLPGRSDSTTLKSSRNVAAIIARLAQPVKVGAGPAGQIAGMSFSEIVGMLYGMSEEKVTKAKFFLHRVN